jgi:GTPase
VDAAARLRDEAKESLVELMLQSLQAQGREELESDVDTDSGSDSENDEGDDYMITVNDDLKQKFAVVLNKADLVKPKNLLLEMAMEIGEIAQQCVQYRGQTDVLKEQPVALDSKSLDKVMPPFFYVSALKNQFVDDIVGFLLKKATPSNHFEVEPGLASSMEPLERIEEIIREKLYRCLHKEIPHSIRQKNRIFEVRSDRISGELIANIHQDLIVTTKSHYNIVQGIGTRTSNVKRIHETAERDLEKALQCKVRLVLNVKLAKSSERSWSI